jgi:hypothetical protein
MEGAHVRVGSFSGWYVAESGCEIFDLLVYRLGVTHLNRPVQDRQAQVLKGFAPERIHSNAGSVGKVGGHEIGLALEARHALDHVVREADLAHFAVADHVDANFVLTHHHVGNSLADTFI